MDYPRLSSRAVRALILQRLETLTVEPWVTALTGEPLPSDQAAEDYVDLGMVPGMREWIGERQPAELRERPLRVYNKPYEDSLVLPIDSLRRDKTGLLRERIGDLATRATTHWNELVVDLVANGETVLAYDGQAFFSAAHAEDAAVTAQSNITTVDLSNLPVGVHGTAASAPSQQEMQMVLFKGVESLKKRKDDRGKTINQHARSFLILAPLNLLPSLAAAISAPFLEGQSTNTLMRAGWNFELMNDAGLDTAGWSDKFAVFRSGEGPRAIYRQEETGVNISSQAEGSPDEFYKKRHVHSVDVRRAVFPGAWQSAELVKMVP
jgi:phage major head subunit gpT-like protein